jgi:hypothetical protein
MLLMFAALRLPITTRHKPEPEYLNRRQLGFH